MVYIMNKSGGDSQQGGCLYKPTSGIQRTPKHSWTSERPQKQAADQSTFGSGVWYLISLLIELWIGDENCSLPLCAYVAGFCKFSHNYSFFRTVTYFI